MNHLLELRSFDGPNIVLPQPGVWLRLAATNAAEALVAHLKDYAARAGVVIGGVRVEPGAADVALSFATPDPAGGAALARLAAETVLAAQRGDQEFDPDEALYTIGRDVRRRALPLSALQLLAEAQARGVPAWPLPDGGLQLGTGARGAQIPAAQLGSARPDQIAPAQIGVRALPAAPPQPDWDALGAIPLVAVVGADAAAWTSAQAAALPAGWRSATAVTFDALRALLGDHTLQGLIAALDLADLAARGAAVERFAQCVTLPLAPDARPEQRRAAALAQLLSGP